MRPFPLALRRFRSWPGILNQHRGLAASSPLCVMLDTAATAGSRTCVLLRCYGSEPASGHAALQVVACPPGQRTGAPAQQWTMSQSWVPAGAFGHNTTQLAPLGHSLWHGPLSHANVQEESTPQAQDPLAQVPSQRSCPPRQLTWQGGAPHWNEQLAPRSQLHVPLAQVASQLEASPHSTLQGGAAHESSHATPSGQTHVSFEQSRRPSRSQPASPRATMPPSASNKQIGEPRTAITTFVTPNGRFGSNHPPTMALQGSRERRITPQPDVAAAPSSKAGAIAGRA